MTVVVCRFRGMVFMCTVAMRSVIVRRRFDQYDAGRHGQPQ